MFPSLPKFSLSIALVALVAWTCSAEWPVTSVSFRTSDARLQRLFDAAEAKAATNIVQFTPTMKILVEGGGYENAWIETQPMGGEMYAKRNIDIALNNQVIFMQSQRADGRFPGMIVRAPRAGTGMEGPASVSLLRCGDRPGPLISGSRPSG